MIFFLVGQKKSEILLPSLIGVVVHLAQIFISYLEGTGVTEIGTPITESRGHAMVWLVEDGRSWVRFPIISLEFFCHNMALGLTQTLTELSTRNIS